MRNIIFLTKDILRKDYLRCYNDKSSFQTPNIDKLASEGTLFNRYYCSAPSSGMAVTSMFSGLEPHQLDRKNFGEVDQFSQGQTLFNELEEKGIKTFVTWAIEFHHLAFVHSKIFDKNTKVDYAPRGGSREVTPQDHAFSKVRKEQKDFTPYNLAEYFLKFFSSVRESVSGPWFIWCHAPHVFHPEESYGSDIEIFDNFVGDIMKNFDVDLILSADHGHSRAEHGRITYGYHLNEGAIGLPLITPNFFNKRQIDYPVGQTQIKEIILNKKIESNDFIYSDTTYYEQLHRKLMILKDNYKYIYNKSDKGEELYDLDFDPQENINLLIEKFPDPERNNYYGLDEIIYYPSWEKAEDYYNILSEERKRIWREGSIPTTFLHKLNKLRKQGLLNSLKGMRRKEITLPGRWNSRARLPSF